MTGEEQHLLEMIGSRFHADGRVGRKRRLWVNIDNSELVEVCGWLKERGFLHLSAISVTDLMDEGKYELTYHLWSYDRGFLTTLKTKVDRDQAVVDSVVSIWNENAQVHEREMHELFGVLFQGNEDLSPLFLEDWHGPPPFRKDFNWRDYVGKEDYDREKEREAVYYD